MGPGTGNAYGAGLELVYEQSADGLSVKETILLHDRPQTNVLTYDLRVDGLTIAQRGDGSLNLVDHAGRVRYRIPAPTLHDATGQAGAATFRLAQDQFDIVLDPVLLSTGALPFTVDPTVIFQGANLQDSIGAPWQRHTLWARDGTQALLLYDPTAGNSGIRLRSSVDNFVSQTWWQDAIVIPEAGTGGGNGGGGGAPSFTGVPNFSVEIDSDTDTAYVVITYMGSSSVSYARVYSLPYSPATRTWSFDTSSDVYADASSSLGNPTVAVGRDPATNASYLWVGVDAHQNATQTYIYNVFTAPLSVFAGSGGWSFDPSQPLGAKPGAEGPHYAAIIATGTGIMLAGRTPSAPTSTSRGMVSAERDFNGNWASPRKFLDLPSSDDEAAEGDGKYYAMVNVVEPASPLTHTTLVAFAPKRYSVDGQPSAAMHVYYRRDGSSANWSDLIVTDHAEYGIPQLSWDGTSFYLTRLLGTSPTATDWQVLGRRGVTRLDGTAVWEVDEDRPLVNEGDPTNRNITWLEVPRRVSGGFMPVYYLRHRSGNDDIAVQVERMQMLGDRPGWEYREVVMPGAGTLKVNLANGNLHYQMTDALFPARQWSDEITRSYDSWATETDPSFDLLGPGWSASFQPRLQLLPGDPNRVVYWAGDGTRYWYAKSDQTGLWVPELGMYATLEKPDGAPTDKTWQLTDVYGNLIYFDDHGRPTRKQDSKATAPSTWVWTNTNTGGSVAVLTGSTGRTQTFTLDASNHVQKIRVAADGSNYFDYEYGYDANGRLHTATLATNTEFAGTNAATRVRVTYDYDPNGRLDQITTPEGNVYWIGYDTSGRVASIDLPDPTSGAGSFCDKPYPRHCWEFSYASGLGETRVTDPGDPYAPTSPSAHPWITRAYGSGQVYLAQDPLGGYVYRTWTVFGNLNTETDQLGQTTSYVYDEKGNRLAIIDPVNGAAGKVTRFTYDEKSRRTSRQDTRGNYTNYTYNADGLLEKETDPEGNFVQFAYTNGDLTQTTNPRGNLTTFTYDANGQVATQTTPDGAKVQTTRDVWARPIQKRVGRASGWQSDDRVTQTVYDGLSRATYTRVRMGADANADDPADFISWVTYDRDGNVLSRTNPNSKTTTIALDRRGRVTSVEGPPANGGSTGADRACVATAYDQRGYATLVQTASSRNAYTVCAPGAGGISWSTLQRAYDARGLLTREWQSGLNGAEYAGGTIDRFWAYDAAGRVLQAMDAAGRYEQYTYDALGRKLTAESAVVLTGVGGPGCHGIPQAVCSAAAWVYDEVGNVLTEQIPTGAGASQTTATRTYTYDTVQRVLTRTDELGRTTSYAYDADGNRLSETAPLGRTTTWAYDAGDRPISVTDPLFHSSTTTYDAWDNPSTVTNALGQVTVYQYDKANRLIYVTDPLGQTSTLVYDKNGNRTNLVDPRGNVQTTVYDDADRPTRVQTPPATGYGCTPTCIYDVAIRTATAAYALDGLVTSETDFAGQQRSYTYDSARRLQIVDYAGATPDVAYAWDKLGRRTILTQGGLIQATYAYDEWGRLLSETRGPSVIRYRYDRQQQTRLDYPDGKTLVSTYDAAGQLLSLDDWRGPATGRTSYGYDGAGRRTSRILPNGAATTWTYDPADRLTGVEHRQWAGGPVSFATTFAYDNGGRRTQQVDYDPARSNGGTFGLPTGLPAGRIATGGTAPITLPPSRGGAVQGTPGGLPAGRITTLAATTAQTFAYDADGRLTQETRDGFGTTTWTYDAAGNRLTESSPAGTTSYAYDADNRLTSQTRGGQTTTYTYDRNGAVLGRAGPGQSVSYAWDTAGRLTSVNDSSSVSMEFGYDGDGIRTTKSITSGGGGQTTSYVNDGRGLAQVLQETQNGQTITYVPGVGQYDPSKATDPQRWGYTLSDGQNNRLLVDGNGTLAHRWEWEAFGKPRADGGSTASPFGYGGEQKDDETGLVNLRSRYYDPSIGRFLSRDSLAGVATLAQSWNRYSYVENDPINALDPSGHKKIKWPGGADPDDDGDRARKRAKACKNPGQYTGSCKGGPPNAAYAADGEAQHEAGQAGQAAAAGNLAEAIAHLQAAQHFAAIAGTSAASTVAMQAQASILAAVQSIQGAHQIDNGSNSLSDEDGEAFKILPGGLLTGNDVTHQRNSHRQYFREKWGWALKYEYGNNEPHKRHGVQ